MPIASKSFRSKLKTDDAKITLSKQRIDAKSQNGIGPYVDGNCSQRYGAGGEIAVGATSLTDEPV